MYVPKIFEERRPEILHSLIREHPLGTLVVMTANGLEANHLPFEIDAEPAPHGTLHGHVARANPVWREFDSGVEALVVFNGPQSYVSPEWYPTKQESGKAVPTWNYVVVHARGTLHAIDDPVRARAHLEQLTAHHEAGRPHPWKITDAPADYVAQMLKQVVPIEIRLTQLFGKWKVNQNRAERDRSGVVQGLLREPAMGAREMADIVGRALDEKVKAPSS
jgi:transcriptional regulator